MPIQNIGYNKSLHNLKCPKTKLCLANSNAFNSKLGCLWRHPITYINSMNHNLPTHIDVSGGRNLAKCNEVR